MREPLKIPHILSAEEAKRLPMMAGKPQVRMLFSIGYGAHTGNSPTVRCRGGADVSGRRGPLAAQDNSA
jgi:hypothetical protein